MSHAAGHLLHFVARVAVRRLSLAKARAVVRAAAHLLPRLTVGEARTLADRLEGRGTCLTRALSIAPRVEGGRVAIGVASHEPGRFRAHAWVVAGASPLRGHDEAGAVLAILDPREDWSFAAGLDALRVESERAT